MKSKIWLGRIIPLIIIVLGELGLYYFLFEWLTTSFVLVEVILHILSILIVPDLFMRNSKMRDFCMNITVYESVHFTYRVK